MDGGALEIALHRCIDQTRRQFEGDMLVSIRLDVHKLPQYCRHSAGISKVRAGCPAGLGAGRPAGLG
eukprot:703413-Pyramimonas_sp.AAC.1